VSAKKELCAELAVTTPLAAGDDHLQVQRCQADWRRRRPARALL